MDVFSSTSVFDLSLLLLALVLAISLLALAGVFAWDEIDRVRAERQDATLNNLHRPYTPPAVPSTGRATLAARTDLHVQPYGARR